MWYGVNLAHEKPERLLRELDALKSLGVNNLRVLAVTQGPDTEPWRIKPAVEQWDSAKGTTVLDEKYLQGLDLLISEAGRRDMTVVVALSNFWFWSGGFAQYVRWFSGNDKPIPYPMNKTDKTAHERYINYTQEFYNCPKCMLNYNAVADKIILRKNTKTGVVYKDDPTIMAWELANGPYPGNYSEKATNWIRAACENIKKTDKNHLVAIGNTGNLHVNYYDSIKLDCIDYGTLHVWPENFGWYNPKDSKTFDNAVAKTIEFMKSNIEGIRKLFGDEKKCKPIILEEFGLARDNRGLGANSTTQYRDQFYSTLFQFLKHYMDKKMLSGVNFWAWAGEGRPRHTVWQQTDDWVGDPPNEDQGWYSVYDNDTTLDVVRKYTRAFVPAYAVQDHTLKWSFWVFIGVPLVVVVAGISVDLLKRRKDDEDENLLVAM
eukprot:TRINITY_DN1469_c0_g1_i5.p1 TRINITY_DN1469_c0_g1~~TRINITY_DN1469_c0_g1_i5.p1  ORF type:complete len:432 (-),score=93.92 TRINITY_DN1469_c0_g1_i5:48-1343(-)